MVRGIPISEKTYELIKQMLVSGYSVKKIIQLLPDEIKVSRYTIYKVDKCTTYKEYVEYKDHADPEPANEPKKEIVPYMYTEKIEKKIDSVNEKLDRLCGLLEELVSMLK